MKTPIAITLIIAGGLLILAPFVFNAIHEAQLLATYVARTDIRSINLGHENVPGSVSRFGCWVVGVVMILTAIVTSRHSDARKKSGASQVESVPAVA